MVLPDVNVLVNAHRADAPDHAVCGAWLGALVNGDQAYGISDFVLSGFIRVVTHPRVFNPPTKIEDAVRFAEMVRGQPHCVPLGPGQRHWGIFTGLCRASRVKGNLVPDAYLAALAIESGSEWVTMDGDYARFPGLRLRRPG